MGWVPLFFSRKPIIKLETKYQSFLLSPKNSVFSLNLRKPKQYYIIEDTAETLLA